MLLLEPSRCFYGLPPCLDQTVNFLAEDRIGQDALNPVSRDRLQDNPGIVRDLPELRIKVAPYFIGGMIPR